MRAQTFSGARTRAHTQSSSWKKGEAMTMIAHSSPERREGELRIQLLIGALFPLFLASAAIQRALPGVAQQRPLPASPSILAEARDNAAIAVSYALMARAMLQSFARDTRAERLS